MTQRTDQARVNGLLILADGFRRIAEKRAATRDPDVSAERALDSRDALRPLRFSC